MSGNVRRGRALIVYTVIRLAAFVVPFLVVWAIGGNATIAAFVAAIVGVCLSVIFFSRQRAALAGAVEDRVTRRRSDPAVVTDEDAEDSALDAPDQGSSASAAASPKP